MSFNKTEFKKWLDCLAALVCKARDGFICQIRRPGCRGKMLSLDRACQWHHVYGRGLDVKWLLANLLTVCPVCHEWATLNRKADREYFKQHNPGRQFIIDALPFAHTWREADYKAVEAELLTEAISWNVDFMDCPETYREKLGRKLHALKHPESED